MSQNDEIVEKLIKEDEGFRSAFKAHKRYGEQVAKMEKKGHLTDAEIVETKRLKKLKLAMKDEMEKILSRARF